MDDSLKDDVAAIASISAVPTILEVVCRTTGMGFAAVARVTDERWIACGVRDEIAFGLKPGAELPVQTTICSELRQSGEPVVIEHVARDNIWSSHPTPAMYGFQSYVSFPIVLRDGSIFGTLCAIGTGPARVNTPETLGMFKLFAELIALHLNDRERLAASEASLVGERQTSELREQFIAVLGHDLRNPLASIEAGARVLLRSPLEPKAASVVALMQNSVKRMSTLIDDVLDFARGRLGGGLRLDQNADAPLEPVLAQVVAELQSVWTGRTIISEFALAAPIDCDRARIGQLCSNLLSNALTYGDTGAPVRVRAVTNGGVFELSVANAGQPIPAPAVERLFQPFARGSVRPSQNGLGLGLYIAAEIARAHGGTIEAVSDETETRFTLRMPLG